MTDSWQRVTPHTQLSGGGGRKGGGGRGVEERETMKTYNPQDHWSSPLGAAFKWQQNDLCVQCTYTHL